MPLAKYQYSTINLDKLAAKQAEVLREIYGQKNILSLIRFIIKKEYFARFNPGFVMPSKNRAGVDNPNFDEEMKFYEDYVSFLRESSKVPAAED